MVAAIAVGAIVAGFGTYAWQRTEVRDRQSATAQALREADAVRAELIGSETQVDALRARLAEANSGSDAFRRQLRQARAELLAISGPPLADGRHFGGLVALGTAQVPPRLVIDVARFFTGDAADQAAIEDGNMPPGQTHVANDVYIRNVDPRWRILMIDPSATVSLTTFPYGSVEDPKVVSLERFGDLFDSRDTSLRWFPYWITVRGDTVVRIEEQYMP